MACRRAVVLDERRGDRRAAAGDERVAEGATSIRRVRRGRLVACSEVRSVKLLICSRGCGSRRLRVRASLGAPLMFVTNVSGAPAVTLMSSPSGARPTYLQRHPRRNDAPMRRSDAEVRWVETHRSSRRPSASNVTCQMGKAQQGAMRARGRRSAPGRHAHRVGLDVPVARGHDRQAVRAVGGRDGAGDADDRLREEPVPAWVGGDCARGYTYTQMSRHIDTQSIKSPLHDWQCEWTHGRMHHCYAMLYYATLPVVCYAMLCYAMPHLSMHHSSIGIVYDTFAIA
jgi:hypothetical protein